MLRRARSLSVLGLVLAACGLEETGAGPAAGGSGGGTSGGSGGGSGGGGVAGSGGAPGGGSGGALGGASGSGGSAGSDAALDAPSDAPPGDATPDADAEADAASDGGIVTALAGARIELPCTAVTSSVACVASQVSKTFAFEGQLGTSYDVTLRFRGVVEENAYSCAAKVGSFCSGGSPVVAGWNVFSIKVGDPAQIYYLNAGTAGVLHCWPLDYQATIPIKGGAAIELAGDAIDGQQVRNIDAANNPIVVPGVSPAPQAYDGQFVQIDVVSIQAK